MTFRALSTDDVATHTMHLDGERDAAWLAQQFPPASVDTLAAYAPVRRHELLAGRYCARQALARIMLSRVRWIPTGRHRAPIWPVGTVGSITHTATYVAAAVARTDRVRALGIDTEEILAETTAQEIADVVARPKELEIIRTAHPALTDHRIAVSLCYSMKESLFKCLYPLARRYVDFMAARIDAAQWETRTLHLSLCHTWADPLPRGWQCEGHFALDAERVHTWVVLPRRHGGMAS